MVVEKDRVVDTIEAIAVQLRVPVRDQLGRPRFGGHSMRVSGSQWLASIGIDLYKIQLLGRWASEVLRICACV